MVVTPRRKIQAFVDSVVAKFHPVSVILFGSHAWGRPTKDSDVDLLVISRHRRTGAAAATSIRLACPRDFPLDLLVRTPAQVRRSVEAGDSFLAQVMTEGIVLYESDHATVGR